MPRMDCTKEIAGVSILSVEQIMDVLAYKMLPSKRTNWAQGLQQHSNCYSTRMKGN